MREDRPNVTVVYQDAPQRAPGLGAVIVEALFFLAVLGIAAMVAGLMGKW